MRLPRLLVLWNTLYRFVKLRNVALPEKFQLMISPRRVRLAFSSAKRCEFVTGLRVKDGTDIFGRKAGVVSAYVLFVIFSGLIQIGEESPVRGALGFQRIELADDLLVQCLPRRELHSTVKILVDHLSTDLPKEKRDLVFQVIQTAQRSVLTRVLVATRMNVRYVDEC